MIIRRWTPRVRFPANASYLHSITCNRSFCSILLYGNADIEAAETAQGKLTRYRCHKRMDGSHSPLQHAGHSKIVVLDLGDRELGLWSSEAPPSKQFFPPLTCAPSTRAIL